ncbi:TIGR03503 family protein [Vibrio paucivorans]|uniref:TIGR03503 family protein n=1 Tax=Vibrio paucivorans TaxID=2829489 RepID=A0A9X3CBX9_9VIBR|nr:TIGR03503 family protein [Vibrio paucivorans]MCW8332898.1 TIGR03503 family protein [Vibrio paucivorans]
MLRILIAIIGLVFSVTSFASGESSMSLLDNRFRVDPTIKQITFVIYRAERSQPVVLVRPDGKKYYAWRSPDNVQWYQESAMDIISVDNPMPGPWQAVGKVTPKNKIKLISNLALETDVFPNRLFQGEDIKFTARLTSDGKPLVVRDFLDRVNLRVTFTKFVENEETLAKEAKPVPVVIGEFSDDGTGLDEFPGDGVFTVSLPISPEPGKYRVRVTSGNGVFLRAQEQEVLVYPTPVQATFIQSREDGMPHEVAVSGEQGMIAPGSLALSVKHMDMNGAETVVQNSSQDESMSVSVKVPNSGELGNFTWNSSIYATDLASGRALSFMTSDMSYSVLEEVDYEATRKLQEQQQLEQQKRLEEMRLIEMREEKRMRSILLIVGGNVFAILLGLVAWFIRGKLRAKKEMMPEMQLDMPKK